jgi:cytoskeletal protein CcmA (bactofilin family)
MERHTYGRDIANALQSPGEEDTVEVRTLRGNEAHTKDAASHALDAAAAQKMSVLGKTLVFKGELKANEDLLIQGRVEGSITHSASHLAIGANGDVSADVHAQRVIVQGKLEGDVQATESVTIEVSANVRGNIYAPRVAIKDGAKFRGTIDMDFGPGAAEAPTKGTGSNRRAKPKADPGASDVDEMLK